MMSSCIHSSIFLTYMLSASTSFFFFFLFFVGQLVRVSTVNLSVLEQPDSQTRLFSAVSEVTPELCRESSWVCVEDDVHLPICPLYTHS